MRRTLRPAFWAFLALVLFLPLPGALAGEEAPPTPESALLTADEVWAKLQLGNRRFVQGRPMRHDLVGERTALAYDQRAWVVVLGCADSHVPPELLFDQSLGDMFVVRTAGNVADAMTIGSIEYAIAMIQPRAIVVLGHERCGAVLAAARGVKDADRASGRGGAGDRAGARRAARRGHGGRAGAPRRRGEHSPLRGQSTGREPGASHDSRSGARSSW